MNIIGIDPSLISTAVVINGKLVNYCRESDAYNKSGFSKWYKLCEEFVEYKFIKYRTFESYSEGELTKLKDYDFVTDNIISDIKLNLLPGETRVGIEGYSFSSDPNSIIDLVTFSTLLRKKIWDQITRNILVLSPSSLKLEACRLTYPSIDIGKKKPKLEWRNFEGMSGGKFTKTEIFKSIVENKNWDDKWSNHCRSVQSDILSNKTIKKPYEDLDDAFIISKYLESI